MTTLADQLAVLAEEQKHALELEQKKWEFKQKELIFLEAGQHMRALNQLMWQAPTMAIAVTGGLWYGAATVEADGARSWVFAFAGLVDLLTIVTLFRLRQLIGNEIRTQQILAGPPPASPSRKHVVIACWAAALITAALISFLGAAKSDTFKKTAERATPPTVNALYTQTSCLSPSQPAVSGDSTPKDK
jgi:hypothetical protein